MISRLLIFFFLVSHYIPQQPEIILMPFTLDFSHCYLILNGYFPLFLHLVMSVRFSALLGAALLLFKSFCPFFLLNILVKGNTCLVFLLSPPPPQSFITSKFLLLSKLFHFPPLVYSHYCKCRYQLVFHFAIT